MKTRDGQLFSMRGICARFDVSPSWIYKLLADGKFPKPAARIGDTGRLARWTREQLDAWANEQIARTGGAQ